MLNQKTFDYPTPNLQEQDFYPVSKESKIITIDIIQEYFPLQNHYIIRMLDMYGYKGLELFRCKAIVKYKAHLSF